MTVLLPILIVGALVTAIGSYFVAKERRESVTEEPQQQEPAARQRPRARAAG